MKVVGSLLFILLFGTCSFAQASWKKIWNQRYIQKRHDGLIILSKRLGTPELLIQQKKSLLDSKQLRLKGLTDRILTQKRHKLEKVMSLLDSFSPLKVVDRGYSIISKNGELIRSVYQVKMGDSIEIQMTDGTVKAQIT